MKALAKSDEPLDWRLLEQQLLFIAFVIGLPIGIGTAGSIFRDGDVSWHIAAGNWILSHGRIPTTDPFSFTAAGHPCSARVNAGSTLPEIGNVSRMPEMRGPNTVAP